VFEGYWGWWWGGKRENKKNTKLKMQFSVQEKNQLWNLTRKNVFTLLFLF
jgi:hypothetical protein